MDFDVLVNCAKDWCCSFPRTGHFPWGYFWFYLSNNGTQGHLDFPWCGESSLVRLTMEVHFMKYWAQNWCDFSPHLAISEMRKGRAQTKTVSSLPSVIMSVAHYIVIIISLVSLLFSLLSYQNKPALRWISGGRYVEAADYKWQSCSLWLPPDSEIRGFLLRLIMVSM